MESALFTPPTDSVAAILADARRADLSFTDLAARHNTTPDALALWLATAEIAHIVETTDAMVCYRTRLIAADKTGHAVGTCVHILEAFNKAAASSSASPASHGRPAPPGCRANPSRPRPHNPTPTHEPGRSHHSKHTRSKKSTNAFTPSRTSTSRSTSTVANIRARSNENASELLGPMPRL